jgi:hypothetical protein
MRYLIRDTSNRYSGHFSPPKSIRGFGIKESSQGVAEYRGPTTLDQHREHELVRQGSYYETHSRRSRRARSHAGMGAGQHGHSPSGIRSSLQGQDHSAKVQRSETQATSSSFAHAFLGIPTLLKVRFGIIQGRHAVRAPRHRTVDGHRPEPSADRRDRAGLVDAADAVLVDRGAEASRHGESATAPTTVLHIRS